MCLRVASADLSAVKNIIFYKVFLLKVVPLAEL